MVFDKTTLERAMRAGAYVADEGRQVTLLIPAGLGPAEGHTVATDLLGTSQIEPVRTVTSPSGTYVTYIAGGETP